MTAKNQIPIPAKAILRSSLCGPARNRYSTAFAVVALIAFATLLLAIDQHWPAVLRIACGLNLAFDLFWTGVFLWNRVGWIEIDVEMASFVVHTSELDHRIALRKSLEWVEGCSAKYQSIAFRQGGHRLKFRYRSDPPEGWESLNRSNDKIVPSLRVSSDVGRALHRLVRDCSVYKIEDDNVIDAWILSEAFSAARAADPHRRNVDLPN